MKLGISSAENQFGAKTIDGKPHWGGAGWARIGQYLDLYNVEVVVGKLVWYYDCFKVQDNNEQIHDVDVILLQRLMNEGLYVHVRQARAIGQVVINDIDDWYWGLDPSNNAWASSHPKNSPLENTKHYRDIVLSSSLITVSTPYIKDQLNKWNPNCEIEVIPNYVDTKRFTKHDHTDNQPLVGWVGSTAHRSKDLEILRGILTTTQNYKLYHGGHAVTAPLFSDKVGLPKTAVATAPLVSSKDYQNLLIMDVGLAPLRDCSFNNAKSDIKLLEYSASGIPWIASPSPAYNTLAQTFNYPRLAKRPKDWLRHLRELTSDVQLRRAEGDALYELAKSRDISVGAKKWNDLLANVLK